MRKFMSILVVLLFLPFIRAENDDDLLTIDNGNYCILQLENALYMYNEGYPILPYYVKTYTYPAGTKINEINVEAKKIEEIKLEKKIQPAPPAIPLNMEYKYEIKEGEIYSKDEFYPNEWYDYSIGMGIKDGKRVVFLNIYLYPVRYNAIRNEVLYARDFDISIDYKLPSQPLFNKDEYDLLIICPSKFEDELQELKQFKESQGIKTIVISLDEIYNGLYFPCQGRDDAEKIKYFIKNAIEQWGIKYVILAGDADVLPVRYAYTVIEDVPSDLYFADIYYANGSFCSWDLDKDGLYGERLDDKPDLYPDIYIGRLPASEENGLKILINKIINYEEPPMRALMVGTELFWDTEISEGDYLKEIISQEINMEIIKLYETNVYPSDGYSTAENIIKYIKKGMLFVNFASHGNPYGMGWQLSGFYISHVNMLTNRFLPIVFAMACSTNQFDTTDCLGERFVLRANGGAIAYAGSSRVAYVYLGKSIKGGLSGYLDKAFFKAHYDGCLSIGEIFARAKEDYLTNHPFKNDYDVLTVIEYNLLGDPSIKISSQPLTSKAIASKNRSNTAIKIWAETQETNVTIDLYYRKVGLFWGGWQLYDTLYSPPYEWEFLPEEEGYYEFYTSIRVGNYTENKPAVADTSCYFDFSSPSINITKPEEGAIYLFNRKLIDINKEIAIIIGRIDVVAEGDVARVEFYLDNELMYTDYDSPFTWKLKGVLGNHEIKVVGYDMADNVAEDEVKIFAVML